MNKDKKTSPLAESHSLATKRVTTCNPWEILTTFDEKIKELEIACPSAQIAE